MSRNLFEDNPTAPCGTKCYTPVEDIWEKIERQLCNPKKKCCPPRTKARDAIRIEYNERGRCFFYGRKLCDGTKEQSVINRYYRMDLRQKGYCDVLMCIPPERATMDGSICWSWPKEFHRLPTGYYEADIYIDNCLCHTHLFYIPVCNVVAKAGEVEYEDRCNKCLDCGCYDIKDCNCNCNHNDCCSAIPVVDDEVKYADPVDCERGCGQC